AIKAAHPEIVVIADLCLCEYTSHGHCGLVREDGTVDNDGSLELLARTAVSQARAGADVIAPSDMMDGRVGAIRTELDAEGFSDTPIIAYSAKFASAFYGPFREAAESAPAFGDRRGYQMDPANVREALRECELDVAEGADVLMIKPALPYLDVIRAARERFELPIAAYNVSGEYAMLKAAATATATGCSRGDRCCSGTQIPRRSKPCARRRSMGRASARRPSARSNSPQRSPTPCRRSRRCDSSPPGPRLR